MKFWRVRGYLLRYAGTDWNKKNPTKIIQIIKTASFVFERTKHQPCRNLRSNLVLQRLCNEAALSPGIDVFWY